MTNNVNIFNTFDAISKFNEIGGSEKKLRDIHDPDVLFQLSLIEEEFEELTLAMTNKNLTETLDAIGDMIVVISGLGHRLGFNTQEIMDIINESNFSKFCYSIEEAKTSVNYYQNNDRYENIHYELIDGVYVIKGEPKGGNNAYKILKGINYKSPENQIKALILENEQ